MIPFLSPGFQALPDASPFGSGSLSPNAPPGGGLLGQLGLSPEMIQALRAQMGQMQGDPGRLNMLREQLMANPEIRSRLLQIARPQNPNAQEMVPPPSGGAVSSLDPSVYGPGGALDHSNQAGPRPNENAGFNGGLNRGMQKRVEAGKELPPGIQRRQAGATPRSGGAPSNPGADMQARRVPSQPNLKAVTPDVGLQSGPAAGPAPGSARAALGPAGQYRERRMMGMLR